MSPRNGPHTPDPRPHAVEETLKEEKRKHGASKTAKELESYIYGLTWAVDVVEKYVDKEDTE